ncbi:SpoIIE family protein phosphatase [Dyella sp. A6]|uniref:SpoIIE family protein phosphatase n=1 Tax=Dyella aluminiiresistens TaxID=3069105 RepID=UPI002E7880E4|nr:SpoIIE family protein phosphatase [Dyella sp. A6]
MKGLRSIASRLAAWSLLGSALVVMSTGWILLGHLRQTWLRSAHREGGTLALAAAHGIEAHLARASEATQLLARLAQTHPELVAQLARSTLLADNDIAGLAFTWTPADTAHPPPAPFIDRLADGALAQRDLSRDSAKPYWKQRWFQTGLTCTDGCWQRPFYSLSRQQRLINYSVAIQQNGQSVGIVNADVTLSWLAGVLGSLKRPDGAVMFVIGPSGHFLAHDGMTRQGETASPGLLSALAVTSSSPGSVPADVDPAIRERAWLYRASIQGTHWTLGLLVPKSLLENSLQRLFLHVLALGLLAMLGIAVITLVVTRRTLAPLTMLTLRAEHVARGDLEFTLPRIKRPDEVGRLTHAFDMMRRQLARHIASLTAATREQERLRSELEIAHQIQVALLPSEHYLSARTPTFELHATLRPARAVGGDLYSYFMLDAQHFCLMVGDVSDKGIPAALFMARAITLAKALAPHTRQPSHLLEELNRELCQGNESCMFITLLCGVIDIANGRLTFASAGHEPPILCRAGSSRLFQVETGPAIGLDEDAIYGEQSLTLRSGDTLLMYTDGVTEASRDDGSMFGIERALDSLVRKPLPADPAAFTSRLLSDVDAFAAGCDQADDITILALNWSDGDMEEFSMLDLTLEPTTEQVFAALDRCETLLDDAGVPPGTREDVRLVLEELMVNMAQHGHAGGDGSIQLRLRTDADAVLAELHDDGTPFDPLQAPAPNLTGDIADPDQVGGLGIHLVRAMASDLSYHHDHSGNHLQLRFIYPDPKEVTT